MQLPASTYSLRDLTHLSSEQWRPWLTSGVRVWVSETTDEERLAAFAPFVLDPREDGPRQLKEALRQQPVLPTSEAALNHEILGALERWAPEDGIGAAVFLLHLAAWSVQDDLTPAIRSILRRPSYTLQPFRRELSNAMTFAVVRRLTAEDALTVGRRMRETGIYIRTDLVRIAVKVAAPRPRELVTVVREVVPEVFHEDVTEPAVELLTDLLVDQIGMADLAPTFALTDEDHAFLQYALRCHRISVKSEKGRTTFIDKLTMRQASVDVYVPPDPSLDFFSMILERVNNRFNAVGIGDLGLQDE